MRHEALRSTRFNGAYGAVQLNESLCELQTVRYCLSGLALLSFPAAVRCIFRRTPIRRKRRSPPAPARVSTLPDCAGRTRYRGEMRPVQL